MTVTRAQPDLFAAPADASGKVQVPEAWAHLPFFADGHHLAILEKIGDRTDILPPRDQVFAALEAVAPGDVRVVILGQDPYPTPGHAHGLAFSVAPRVRPLPASLRNIFAELQEEFGTVPPDGNLGFWAAQGVLLLNTALTVEPHNAGAHAKLGWDALTREVLHEVSGHPTAFVLWGRHAQGFRRDIRGDRHLVLETPHPSPLSARRGFFGSQPFSKVNAWLKAGGNPPINWTTP
ncbi:uracil-DNA glycosylase [Chachezhania sediminis]|uniref:uracil-DNA glycosylase n=1 Tax=Chachezhania sediminis TaxID=2599291 RepID=UPI00131B32B4|nr:uracil-DNA glycosylase [Chachezhania sediminis]